MELDTQYITKHANGFQVRLPARAGGATKFFSVPQRDTRVLSMATKARTLKAAIAWRDKQFSRHDQVVKARIVNNPNAGVSSIKDGRSGQQFVAATWMYEHTQIKRMFAVSKHGEEKAFILAHIARDLGVRVEADRLDTEL